MTRAAPAWQLLLAFALSLLVLCGLIGWLENVHIISANGMYKSIQAEPWIAEPSTARLDQSNYLFFPLYGVSARLLDALGILRGVAWKQFAYLNAFWASIGTVIVYAFVHRLTGSARVAALTSVFHLGCGFVLLLSVISEDIMPGYVFVLASMALAGLWFDRPTWQRIAIVGAVFTIGWLIEWRLLFPTLPAFVLALLIAPEPLKKRVGPCARAAGLDPGGVGHRPASVGGPQRRDRAARHPVDGQGRGHRLGRHHLGQGLDDAVRRRQLPAAGRRLRRSEVGEGGGGAALDLGSSPGRDLHCERPAALAAAATRRACALSPSSSSARWGRGRC